ncbi:hypothetical protein NL676_038654 [Syzygium grande]|nr:hypothetical protein NL676_038654 [Syzygium grande]
MVHLSRPGAWVLLSTAASAFCWPVHMVAARSGAVMPIQEFFSGGPSLLNLMKIEFESVEAGGKDSRENLVPLLELRAIDRGLHPCRGEAA